MENFNRRPFAYVFLDWPEDQTEAAAQQNGGDSSKHLWEESWDDDDTTDDFSAQLR
jgi:26 proteasome complex subunit DSS1